MSEDISVVTATFEDIKRLDEVFEIFRHLRGVDRREDPALSEAELLDRFGLLAPEARDILIRQVSKSDSDKKWLLEEVQDENVRSFSLQWSFKEESYRTWLPYEGLVHVLTPTDFPKKMKNRLKITWMWGEEGQIAVPVMIKLFRSLGASKVNNVISYENGDPNELS